jgi:hypothetical protein
MLCLDSHSVSVVCWLRPSDKIKANNHGAFLGFGFAVLHFVFKVNISISNIIDCTRHNGCIEKKRKIYRPISAGKSDLRTAVLGLN